MPIFHHCATIKEHVPRHSALLLQLTHLLSLVFGKKTLQICSTLCIFFFLFLPTDGSSLLFLDNRDVSCYEKRQVPKFRPWRRKSFYFTFSKDFICKCSCQWKRTEEDNDWTLQQNNVAGGNEAVAEPGNARICYPCRHESFRDHKSLPQSHPWVKVTYLFAFKPTLFPFKKKWSSITKWMRMSWIMTQLNFTRKWI